MPNRSHLLSETSPPPINPKLQACLEDYVVEEYASDEANIRAAISKAQDLDISYLPEDLQQSLNESRSDAAKSFELMASIASAKQTLADYVPEYEPIHRNVRGIELSIQRCPTAKHRASCIWTHCTFLFT